LFIMALRAILFSALVAATSAQPGDRIFDYVMCHRESGDISCSR